jgi:hypothetical protein
MRGVVKIANLIYFFTIVRDAQKSDAILKASLRVRIILEHAHSDA